MSKTNRAIKYRIYPTDEQRVLFAKTFGCVHFVYNKLLEAQNDRYADGLKNLSKFDINKYCTNSLKPQHKFLKEVDSLALVNAAFHLDEVFISCSCGYTADRDYNAALNIKKEGLRILKTA